MINKFIVMKWLEDQKVDDRQRYILSDDSIDEDSAYDDVPKEWWLESQMTRVLLGLLIMRGSPKITGDPVSAPPGRTRKQIWTDERALLSQVREVARAEHVAGVARASINLEITNEIKGAKMEGSKGAVIKQKLDMFALHEAAYKAARGVDAHNTMVASLLDKMLGSDEENEEKASRMDE
jgi:hypothetical protein